MVRIEKAHRQVVESFTSSPIGHVNQLTSIRQFQSSWWETDFATMKNHGRPRIYRLMQSVLNGRGVNESVREVHMSPLNDKAMQIQRASMKAKW
jgi:hypothetical protein